MYLDKACKTKPYEAQVTRCGKHVHLGIFATAEEAALCIARSPEGRAAAQKAAAREEGNAPAMPPDAFVMKTEVFVKEEGRSGSRPKRQRRK